ncbi:hypothetical protein [Methyloceanibacter sp.]|uniref:hypothetical protein n=1 Tax=Methyloceanibacter sp. TaxID=1965321 RepID=UPI002D58B470|nr:hypothetical protein [Methyloceanibacter sp.]HZP10692.1 hypothetical protein [Methyloceanibacter sp.]
MRVFASAPASVGILALAFSVLAGADLASAKPSDEQLAAIKANCRSDFMSNCWGVPRGGAEAFQCLKDHLASLSAPCQQAVKAVLATAAPPAGSGTAGSAAKPAAETKPAAAPVESSPAPAPDGAENAATPVSTDKASSAAFTATQSGAATTAAGQSAPSPGAKGESSAAVSAPPAKAAEKAAPAVSSKAAVQGPDNTAATSASDAVSAAKSKSAATEATAPVTPAATGGATPPTIGFIPPRKKFLLARACRADFNAHCPGVDLGQGRAISCLEANKPSLTPDCRDALAKLMR